MAIRPDPDFIWYIHICCNVNIGKPMAIDSESLSGLESPRRDQKFIVSGCLGPHTIKTVTWLFVAQSLYNSVWDGQPH